MTQVSSFIYRRNCELKPDMSFPEGMTRMALVVEYDGARYQGFQRQASAKRTVQAELEKALSYIANEPITLACAGRTDAGVHASAQIIHFDTLAKRPNKAWLKGVNTQLPLDIRIRWASEVSARFHSRFCAQYRRYNYVLYCNDDKPGLMREQISWTRFSLDLECLRQGAAYLCGEHDFSAFRAAQCQAKHALRCIHHIKIVPKGAMIVFDIKANAFLHHMVRNIVGSLIEVGRGARKPEWMGELLASKNRDLAGPTAPANGLYLVEVGYPENLLPNVQFLPYFLS